jgi:hypothetical protein
MRNVYGIFRQIGRELKWCYSCRANNICKVMSMTEVTQRGKDECYRKGYKLYICEKCKTEMSSETADNPRGIERKAR